MPVTIKWQDEARSITHWQFIKPWHWDAFHETSGEARAMLDSVDHKVDHIFDFLQNDGRLPPSAFTNFQRDADNAHPNRGIIVIISSRPTLAKGIIGMLGMLNPALKNLRFAGSIEGALEQIAEAKARRVHELV